MRHRTLNLKEAKSFRDYDRNRRIRNECRTFLTNDTSKISIGREFIFWIRKSFDPFTILYLGYNECNYPIAYGLIHYDGQLRPWLSGGLRRSYRGLGYGRLLFQALCSRASAPVYLEVLCDNLAAVNLYSSLGFLEISREERGFNTVITMRKDCGADV